MIVEDEKSVSGVADAAYASVNYTLAAGQFIELFYANAGATGLTLTGNEIVNNIFGSGGDTLDGASGNDALNGKAGADRLIRRPRYRRPDRRRGQRHIRAAEGHFQPRHDPRFRAWRRQAGSCRKPVRSANWTASYFCQPFLSNGDGQVANGGDADTRFIYNATDGRLYFDADGTGAAAARLIATLSGNPVLISGISCRLTRNCARQGRAGQA